MKKIILSILCLCSITTIQAQTLEIVNKYGMPIHFAIQKGEQYVPGLKADFVIQNGQSVVSEVLKSGRECDSQPYNPAAYISANSTDEGSAFFATGLMCNDDHSVEVSGFISRKLAYTWVNGSHVKLIFCQTSDYPCK